MAAERLPSERPDEPREVEAEVVGLERPASFWSRLKSRLALAAVLGVLGLGFLAAGLVLTLTVIGALAGIPLMFVGLALLAGMVFTLFGGGSIRLLGPRR